MGPPSSGKTALIKDMLEELGKEEVPFSYVNTRLANMTTPAGMAGGLAAGSSTLMKALGAAAEVDLAAMGLDVVNAISMRSSAITQQPRMLTAVLQVYNGIFEANKVKGGPLPV
ncbi:hypothetical protein TSOC_006503, partial [Tetrabaena socialis]